jgi:hypothetical protein
MASNSHVIEKGGVAMRLQQPEVKHRFVVNTFLQARTSLSRTLLPVCRLKCLVTL